MSANRVLTGVDKRSDRTVMRAALGIDSAIREIHFAAVLAAREMYGFQENDPLPGLVVHMIRTVVLRLSGCSYSGYGRAINMDHATIMNSVKKAALSPGEDILDAMRRTTIILDAKSDGESRDADSKETITGLVRRVEELEARVLGPRIRRRA